LAQPLGQLDGFLTSGRAAAKPTGVACTAPGP
jgi:hypothetical protein